MLALYGAIELHLMFKINPDVENIASMGTWEAGIMSYHFARILRFGVIF